MTEKDLDYDLAYECIFRKHVLKDFSKTGLRSGDFNRIFYCFLGKLSESQLLYPPQGIETVITSNQGEIIDFGAISANFSEKRELLVKDLGLPNE